MERARVVGDIRERGIRDAVVRWWFTHLHELYDGNWLLVAAAWHMGAAAVRTKILEPSGLGPAEVDLEGEGDDVVLAQVEDAAPFRSSTTANRASRLLPGRATGGTCSSTESATTADRSEHPPA